MKRDLVGVQLGNYRLVSLLGSGGVADVYLGEHVRISKRAAVKVLQTHLSQDGIDDFRREADIIASLDHPNIIDVEDYDIWEGIPFLVMDYYADGTLRKRHAKGTRVPVQTVLSYVMQIAAALQYAHDRKLVHRDVKPENMLIGQEQRVVLSDFGVASTAHNTESLSIQIPMGTAYYMAPEQVQAQARPASDQYALAIATYEWLAGTRPFEGTYAEVIAKHMASSPQPLRQRVPELSPAIEKVVMTALAKDPKQRYERIQDYALALEAAIKDESGQLPTISSVQVQDSHVAPTPSAHLSGSSPAVEAPPLSPAVAEQTEVDEQLIETVLIVRPQPSAGDSSTQSEESHTPHPALNDLAASSTTPSTNPPIATRPKKLLSIPVIVSLLLMALIIVGGFIGLGTYRLNTIRASDEATATTLVSDNYATQTAVVQATASVVAANPYPKYMPDSGTLFLYNSLSQQQEWHVQSDRNFGGKCRYQNGSFSISQTSPHKFFQCPSTNSFSNFAMEVQMMILQGDCGGMYLRESAEDGTIYYLSICQDGTYRYMKYKNYWNSYAPVAISSKAIYTGVNQTNSLAVVARQNNLQFYINGIQIASIKGDSFVSGKISLMADSITRPTEVVYSQMRIWT